MCLNIANSMEYVEVRVFRPVGSMPAFRLMVFAASTVFGVKVAVASPDAAGVESPEAVDSVDSALLSEAAMLSVDVVELELLPPHPANAETTNAADRTRAKTFFSFISCSS